MFFANPKWHVWRFHMVKERGDLLQYISFKALYSQSTQLGVFGQQVVLVQAIGIFPPPILVK